MKIQRKHPLNLWKIATSAWFRLFISQSWGPVFQLFFLIFGLVISWSRFIVIWSKMFPLLLTRFPKILPGDIVFNAFWPICKDYKICRLDIALDYSQCWIARSKQIEIFKCLSIKYKAVVYKTKILLLFFKSCKVGGVMMVNKCGKFQSNWSSNFWTFEEVHKLVPDFLSHKGGIIKSKSWIKLSNLGYWL